MFIRQRSGGVINQISKALFQTVAKEIGSELKKEINDQAKSKIDNLRRTAEVGQEAHRQIQKELKEKHGAKTEVTITIGEDGKKIRKDAKLPDGTLVIIKPDTESGKRSATTREKLLQKYNFFDIEKIFYDPKGPKYLPNSPSYIGSKTR